jgi:cell volume regulation protein A
MEIDAESMIYYFGVEIPDEIDSQLTDVTLTAEMLQDGNRLMDMHISKGTLVMLVKRGKEFIIPNGRMELKVGDKLLYISENKKEDNANHTSDAN